MIYVGITLMRDSPSDRSKLRGSPKSCPTYLHLGTAIGT